MSDLVKRLRAIDHLSVEDCFCQSALYDQAADRIEALEAECKRLSSTVDTLESLRPHWAQGYSSDSMAAQASTEALVGIWKILGVSDQTSAVVTLKALEAKNDQLRIALTDAESYLGKGLDKMAFNILRAALGENS